ncbi:hypothetical protein C6341_g27126 [Phytophthora cactorum]|nr:hypothetical protein PC122_g15962 [Phytophthora cactorum]KAG3122071.1 hypothetical protein C6341_g27126 [Phytophthora cactorum]
MWSNKLLLARINFRGSVASAKLNKLNGGAQPCPLRSRNRDRARRIETERQRARRAQQSERDRDRTEQVKHRKNAKEYESAIVFGTSDDWKKKPKKKRKRAKSAIAFFSCRTAPGCHRKNVKRGDGKIVFVIKKVEP